MPPPSEFNRAEPDCKNLTEPSFEPSFGVKSSSQAQAEPEPSLRPDYKKWFSEGVPLGPNGRGPEFLKAPKSRKKYTIFFKIIDVMKFS
jgi:hypothetical protein